MSFDTAWNFDSLPPVLDTSKIVSRMVALEDEAYREAAIKILREYGYTVTPPARSTGEGEG